MKKTRLGPELSKAAALIEHDRLAEAAEICRAVLKRNARDVDAHQMLGLVELRGGRFDLAAEHFRKGLQIRPRSAMLLSGLAKAYTSLGRYDEAAQACDRALAVEPGYPPAILHKADALEHLGRFDDATALLAPVVARRAEGPEEAFIYATLLQRAGRHEEAVAVVQRHLAAPKISDITRRKLLFCAGDSYDRLGAVDAAFDAFRRANELLQRPFSIEDVRRRFARIREVFSPAALPSLPRSREESDAPIFIVSMPRSGSTLVEQILAAHPRVFGAGEIDEMTRCAKELAADVGGTPFPDAVERMTPAIAGRLAARYLGHVRALAPAALRIVDKDLRNFRLVGLIALLLPRARVIYCRRDPMAVCFSCYMMPLAPAGLPYTTDLRNLGLYHREFERLMDHWVRLLGPMIKVVDYEEVVADQERMSREIVAFAGLEWDDACLRFYEAGRSVATASYDQVRRPIYAASLKRYERYAHHLAPLRQALAEGAAARADGR
jgi:tetratricopeptide (TPR) repeat protein